MAVGLLDNLRVDWRLQVKRCALLCRIMSFSLVFVEEIKDIPVSQDGKLLPIVE